MDMGRIREIRTEIEEHETAKKKLLAELYALIGVRDEKKLPRAVDKRRSRSALLSLLHKPLV